ncbi:glycosyltransferase [Mucilaginibacter sp. L3T2-6]|uniref:glycosyltransferase family 2 protein n=1 Tax=Mucilaginibacter sp. L3T2-6 TaxID=3062491 RepID=UPI0026749C6B|nr:glycosyltransferase [Mucilaginibacter sp. L3T2-6]MDO3644405.1 glycosyltransferase [Mucilaginibacter sp. L3T2-6]MDV6216857.1 glycosyltransferase [Mucilaginibacter sp. L3T2-6]
MKEDEWMVSICCTTYNHEKFIAQTVESFLMQKTDFKYEIVVSDDCSTDQTLQVLKTYKQAYPDKLKVLAAPQNTGAHRNMIKTATACKGKYVAVCDGDDYWTDPLKLQKQVDFLERNPEYVICCHYTRVIDADNNTLHVSPNPVPLVYTYHDLLVGKQAETKTATVVYRNIPAVNQIFEKPWYVKCHAGDKLLKIFATFITGRKIYVMPEVMSCYRNHTGGIWSMIRNDARMEKMISDFNLIITNFTYQTVHKKKLLLLYVKKYLLFELRKLRVAKAYNTVRYLLRAVPFVVIVNYIVT